MNFFRQALSSGTASIFLSCIYPVLFLYSQNTNVYPLQSIGTALLFMVVLAGVTALLLHLLSKIIRKSRFVFGAVSALFLLSFLYFSIRPVFPSTLSVLLLYCVLILIIAGLCAKFKYYHLNAFLAILCTISCVTIGSNLVVNSMQTIDTSKDKKEITLTHKPDIFIILAESYNSFREQKNEYGIKDSELEKYLQQHNFEIDDVFSNYDHTTASSFAIFYMKHHYNQYLEGLHDLSAQGRGLLNGNTSNAALTILKNNNYYTSFIDCGGYLLKQKGELYDYTPGSDFFEHLPEPLEKPMIPFNLILKKFHVYLKFMNAVDTSITLEEAINSKPEGMPGFYFIREGANHVTYEKKPEEWRKNYRKLIKKGDRKIISLLNVIQEKSPNSIVAIIGDHGGKMYQVQKMEPKDFIKDLYEVLFAVRIPENLRKESIWDKYANSAVNLFPKIFTLLSGDQTLSDGLEKQPQSIDRKGKVIAIDGVPYDQK